jgi:sec-independent protein translocase protein TatC
MPSRDPNQLTFLEHLEEFRQRLIRILIAAAVGTAAAFYFARQLVHLLLAPGGVKFIYVKPAEAFTVYLAVSFIAGLVVASPYIFWEIWRFVRPGLLPRERRFAVPFVGATTLCFVVGVVFGYYLLFPAMRFFRSFASTDLTAQWTIGSYASLALRLVLATGLIFEAPVVVYFLARLGILSHRTLLAKWRIIVVGVFIVAAVLTPGPDMFTQTLLAIPLLLLYVISIVVAALAYPKRRPEDEPPAEAEAEPPAEAEAESPATGPSPLAG